MSEENKGFDASRNFFGTGSQYYIVGRFAVFAWLKPVGGNILHHAIEQLLKGALSKAMPLKPSNLLRIVDAFLCS
jgi:hypothetical protein